MSYVTDDKTEANNPAGPARKGEELARWLDARSIQLSDPETGLSFRRPQKEEAKQEVAAATPRPAGTPGTAADPPANPPPSRPAGAPSG